MWVGTSALTIPSFPVEGAVIDIDSIFSARPAGAMQDSYCMRRGRHVVIYFVVVVILLLLRVSTSIYLPCSQPNLGISSCSYEFPYI